MAMYSSMFGMRLEKALDSSNQLSTTLGGSDDPGDRLIMSMNRLMRGFLTGTTNRQLFLWLGDHVAYLKSGMRAMSNSNDARSRSIFALAELFGEYVETCLEKEMIQRGSFDVNVDANLTWVEGVVEKGQRDERREGNGEGIEMNKTRDDNNQSAPNIHANTGENEAGPSKRSRMDGIDRGGGIMPISNEEVECATWLSSLSNSNADMSQSNLSQSNLSHSLLELGTTSSVITSALNTDLSSMYPGLDPSSLQAMRRPHGGKGA